jgi:hypothetical protein
MGIKKQAGNGQRMGMEEDCIESKGPQQSVALEKKNYTYVKQNGYGVPDINPLKTKRIGFI